MKYTKGLVPNEVLAELVMLKNIVKNGELIIPKSEAELSAVDFSDIEFPF
jgi:basic membrane protein A